MPSESITTNPDQASRTVADGALTLDNLQSQLGDYLGTSDLREMILIIAGPCLALAIAIFILASRTYTQPQVINWCGLIIVVILGHSITRIRTLHEQALLERFARTNHFDFRPTGVVDESYGTIFRVSPGLSRVRDIVAGTFDGHDIRLFGFSYEVPAGRSTRTVEATVCEIDLNGKLPHLLLLNRKIPAALSYFVDTDNISPFFGPRESVSLEGDFNQHFTLLGSPGETEPALEVFTPDIMAIMEDSATKFTTELVANKIYIYSAGLIKQEADLTTMFGIAEHLIPKLDPLARRLATDTTIPTTAPVVLPQTLGLIPKSVSCKVIAVMVAIGMVFPLGVLLFLLISGHM